MEKDPNFYKAFKVVEFAETTNVKLVDQMPVSNIDFSIKKNVHDQYVLWESKGYSILRLPENEQFPRKT